MTMRHSTNVGLIIRKNDALGDDALALNSPKYQKLANEISNLENLSRDLYTSL